MNVTSFKNVALRTFNAAPKTSTTFRSITGTYNTTTGKNDDVTVEDVIDVMLRSKLKNDINDINNTVYTITARISDFTNVPKVDDKFYFDSIVYNIESFVEDHVGALYIFNVEV